MSKLYPPIITGTIPAFYGSTIKIPFQMNRAVSNKEISGFCLKIKTVQNSRLIGTAQVLIYEEAKRDSEGNYILDERGNRQSKSPNDIRIIGGEFDLDNLFVNFYLDNQAFTNDKLSVGQHYKVQLAYVYLDEKDKLYPERAVVGHYSTVGVIKYTSKPKIEIQDLVKKKDNVHRYSYLGIYAQERQEDNPDAIIDTAEKLHSYCFNLYDTTGKLVHTSDWQLYNSIQDTDPNVAICPYNLNKDLNENQKYYIEFEVITINELHEKSGRYNLIQKKSISPNVDFSLIANPTEQIDNGGIVLNLCDNKNQITTKNKILRTGSFKLLRSDEETDYTEWNEVLAFKLFNQEAPYNLFTDYTIKQGVKYKYAIIQYNSYGLQSNKIESNIVSSDFDCIFLSDGKRQLKIKYNPKVSSFKEVVLESKTETIGAKYPFIFKNGSVGYKEFPISGLITSLMDDNYLFLPKRKKSESKERKYEYLYKEVPVVKDKIYYYQEDWEFLFCKQKRYSDNAYLSIRKYCESIGKTIPEGYDSSLDYAIRIINPTYNPKTDKETEKYLYFVQNVKNTKTYWFSEYKDKLYTLFDDEYVKVKPEEEYDKNKRYFLLKIKTKHNSSFDNISFTNDYNGLAVQSEREFKLEVLDWLNNGKPKLFRSPTEGNYIVRLMNSSLTPNEQIGRVLHNFNSTAYEIDDYTFANLLKYEFVVPENLTTRTIRWETVQLNKTGLASAENILKYKAVALRFEGMIAGDKVYINDGILRPTYMDGEIVMKPGYSVVIGATGSYNLDLSDNVVINQVKFEGSVDNIEVDEKRTQHQGTLTYAFECAAFTSFDTIESFKVEITPIKQFFGKYKNVIKEINNIKNQLQEIYFIHAVLRDQYDIYEQKYIDENNQEFIYYTTGPEGGITINLNNDRNCFYRIFEKINNEFIPTKFYDGYHFKFLEYNEEDDKNSDILIINEAQEGIKVFNDNDFFLKEPDHIFSIETGHRVLLELCYQSTITDYGAETEVQKVIDGFTKYSTAQNEYLHRLNSSESVFSLEETYRAEEAMNSAYKEYILILEGELEEQGAIEGELVE